MLQSARLLKTEEASDDATAADESSDETAEDNATEEAAK